MTDGERWTVPHFGGPFPPLTGRAIVRAIRGLRGTPSRHCPSCRCRPEDPALLDSLTPGQRAVIDCLIDAAPRRLTGAELARRAFGWPGSVHDAFAVHQHVYRIRRKLGPAVIDALPPAGYRWQGPG
jgi:hypothetical protein